MTHTFKRGVVWQAGASGNFLCSQFVPPEQVMYFEEGNEYKVKNDFKVDSIQIFKDEIFKLIETDQFIFNNTNLLINKSKYDSISDIKSIDDKYILIKNYSIRIFVI